MNFKDFGLNSKVLAGVNALGFSTPTPIQEKSIGPIMDGNDVLGLAATGTGKTAAFVLPMLHHFTVEKGKGLRGLIIAPTRELAEQIFQAIEDLGRKTKVKAITVYGGTKYKPQIRALEAGVDIIVATPGRLPDHMDRGTIDPSTLEILVLDEADRMFDMGFLPDIRKILGRLPVERQTLLFSATMPSTIRRLAEEILFEPVNVEIAHSKPVDSVAHALYPVNPMYKTELLLELLKRTSTESVLVFTRTKAGAELLGREMKKSGLSVNILQGDMPQPKRKEALEGFRAGKVQILVATDIAARGLDISMVSHVINYDMPPTVDDYTHRIGRTGRAAKTGDAFTLVTHEDLMVVKAIEKVLGEEVEIRLLEDFPYPPPPWASLGRGTSKSPGRARRPGRRRL
ncbi:DEAD/DEAH box helicase [bacterium]|nr:DEAD/DEAH box helicase [bacterium]